MKPLHERLRELETDNFSCIGEILIQKSISGCGARDCAVCTEDVLNKLADEIERDYMLLPKDKNGVPIHMGEMLYDNEGKAHIFQYLYLMDNGEVGYQDAGGLHFEPSELTHEKPQEPDTQEKIDADVSLNYLIYWGCEHSNCSECPSKIDGKTPNEVLKVRNCFLAMRFDLLRRQRELDKRLAMRGEL